MPRIRKLKALGGYRIDSLNATEYETLRWLAARGYDGGILDAAGVERKRANGGAVLGIIPEHKALEINERINEDPHAFLANNGSRTLATKLRKFINRIV